MTDPGEAPSSPGGRQLVVGRLRKPHGLKGDCAVFPLTDDPGEVFARGRAVWVMSLEGEVVAGPLLIERSRLFHREWLLAFQGHGAREAVEGWTGAFLSAPAEQLRPPAEDEVYRDELAGFAVRGAGGESLGVVSRVLDLPAGLTLEVQGARREYLLPFRKEFVREVDREGRRLTVVVPEGMLDL